MLVQFTVENFRSFKSETALSMVATADPLHESHLTPPPEGSKIPPLLRAAAFYGPNAAGKSNLAKALRFVQRLITVGTRADAPTGVERFAMDRSCAAKPARFGFVISWQERLYHYDFELTPERIERECLRVTLHKKEQPLFERQTRPDGKADVQIRHALARKDTKEYRHLEFVAMGTRRNQLFLTEMSERNIDAAKPLVEWFRDVLRVIEPRAQYSLLELRALGDQAFCEFLGSMLGAADTGISSVRAERLDVDLDQQFPGMPAEMKEHIRAEVSENAVVQIGTPGGKRFLTARAKDQPPALLKLQALHDCADGDPVAFEFDQESDGTQRLAHLAPAFFDALKKPGVYFVDELDRSLHPHLTRMLVRLFLWKVPAHGCSQLLFTTHDTNLLDQDLLRRDEIWLVEKDRHQASHLTALAEYRVRPDVRLGKGYLQGRFGAIPFLGDLRRLGLAGDAEESSADDERPKPRSRTR